MLRTLCISAGLLSRASSILEGIFALRFNNGLQLSQASELKITVPLVSAAIFQVQSVPLSLALVSASAVVFPVS